jgi:hypothetical protein
MFRIAAITWEMKFNSRAVACGACGLPITSEDFDWIVPQHQKRIFRILLPLINDPSDSPNSSISRKLLARWMPGNPEHAEN